MSDYVKFRCEPRGSGTATGEFEGFAELTELNRCRQRLLKLGLIGVDSNGIGFGNLSVRSSTTNEFYITGSATGAIAELAPAHCAKVVAYNFETNWVQYEGSMIPSSETLTHAAVYESDMNVGAVIHCHESTLWRALLNEAPATSRAVEYGTPEMAREVMRLLKNTDANREGILVMAGHEGGLISFGRDLKDAFALMMRQWRERTVGCIPLASSYD